MVAVRKIRLKPRKFAKRAVFTTKRKVMDDKFSNKDDVALFRIAKQIRKQNQDMSVKNVWKMMITNWPTLIQRRKIYGNSIANTCLMKSFLGMRLNCFRVNPQLDQLHL